MAIDAIFSLSKTVPTALKPYKDDIIDVLGDLRFDKIRPVRDAAIEAIGAMKEVPDI